MILELPADCRLADAQGLGLVEHGGAQAGVTQEHREQ
jgi:hypothetical protein